jgi:hypothetical protein
MSMILSSSGRGLPTLYMATSPHSDSDMELISAGPSTRQCPCERHEASVVEVKSTICSMGW